MNKKRRTFTTTLDEQLIKEAKILAIRLDKNLNDLIEETLRAILKKHSEKTSEAA